MIEKNEDTTIKRWKWKQAVEQWDMGLTAWGTNKMQYINVMCGESCAKLEASKGRTARGGVRQLCLLLEPRLQNSNYVTHWIRMS